MSNNLSFMANQGFEKQRDSLSDIDFSLSEEGEKISKERLQGFLVLIDRFRDNPRLPEILKTQLCKAVPNIDERQDFCEREGVLCYIVADGYIPIIEFVTAVIRQRIEDLASEEKASN